MLHISLSIANEKRAPYVNVVKETEGEGENVKKERSDSSVVSFHPFLQRDTRDFNYLNL